MADCTAADVAGVLWEGMASFDMWLLLGNHAHAKTCMLSRNGAVVTTIFQESKRLLIDLTIGRGFSFLLFFYRWFGNKRMGGFLMVQI